MRSVEKFYTWKMLLTNMSDFYAKFHFGNISCGTDKLTWRYRMHRFRSVSMISALNWSAPND